ncbi:MAG: alpha/beta fold hydrolase [Candidatus Obscuribacter sp.]|nr:alpha/beta fold hydrolase [Candidatus Obscuribacter sp.]
MKDLVSTPLRNIAGVPVILPEMTSLRMSDGVELAVRLWKGKSGLPVVLYLHGIEGHSQWFENTASVLNQKGITVYAPDRRGAGLNPRDRGNLSSYKTYLGDLEMIIRKLAFDFVGHPIVLIGNCWGAKAASVITQKDYKPVASGEINLPIAGLALTSPAIFTKIDFGASTKMQIAYTSFLGGDNASHRKWPIPLEVNMFTDNPTFQGYLKRDPLRLTEATASFFVESYKLGKLAKKLMLISRHLCSFCKVARIKLSMSKNCSHGLPKRARKPKTYVSFQSRITVWTLMLTGLRSIPMSWLSGFWPDNLW